MSRTTGRCVGAAVAELPVDLEQHGRDEAESRRPLVAAEARNAHSARRATRLRTWMRCQRRSESDRHRWTTRCTRRSPTCAPGHDGACSDPPPDEIVSPADRHTKSARPHITVDAQPNDVTDRALDSAIVMIFNVSGR